MLWLSILTTCNCRRGQDRVATSVFGPWDGIRLLPFHLLYVQMLYASRVWVTVCCMMENTGKPGERLLPFVHSENDLMSRAGVGCHVVCHEAVM